MSTGGKATLLKRPKHKIFILNHSPRALAKGGQHGLELPEESLQEKALGRDMGERLPGSLCLVISPT